jgi:hypothetical protein
MKTLSKLSLAAAVLATAGLAYAQVQNPPTTPGDTTAPGATTPAPGATTPSTSDDAATRDRMDTTTTDETRRTTDVAGDMADDGTALAPRADRN